MTTHHDEERSATPAPSDVSGAEPEPTLDADGDSVDVTLDADSDPHKPTHDAVLHSAHVSPAGTATSPVTSPAAHERTIAYQPALDGVRALAVAAVLLFHGGVAWLPGGFLGVDAFFVLSGFLITSLLLAEHARHGRIRLGGFWLRRARRLLPALILVILSVVVVFRTLLASSELALLRTDALAALGYVANWRMIYRGDDYFTQTSTPSALQHTWSLGIEEQFYLVWPLLVVLLLAVVRVGSRAVLAAVCALGAVGSAIAAAALYQPLDVNRAYFGTDTRAQALLVGAALAALLAPTTVRRPGLRGRWSLVLAGAAVVATATLGWMWVSIDGADAWLYQGGLLVGAMAVAALLAHVTLSPHAPLARLLGCSPLVWLGQISYGLYLWHWPIFQLVNGDRTELRGPQLLLLRLMITVVVAWLSYVLVEQPIRSGRWPWRRQPAALRPVRTAVGATAAIALTTAAVLVATLTPAGPTLTPTGALLSGLPGLAGSPTWGQPSTTASADPKEVATRRYPPVLRPHRKPGAQPRITFLGDSVSWSLGHYLPTYPEVAVTVRSIQGCGIARLPDIRQRGDGATNYPPCPTWDARWRRGINADDPDVAVILLDRWELMDRKLDGVWRHVGDPVYDAYLTQELDLALDIAGSRGARVAVLTAPYTRRAERPDGGLYDEDLPERVDAWNRLLRAVAQRRSEQVTVIDLNARVCPDGEFTWSIDSLQIRSDGLHFTPDGVRQWIAPWLMPQLARMAVTANDSLARGD